MISAASLSKRYGTIQALDDLSFELESGIVAVLGSNGAGKSTLLGILAGAISPDGGNIVLNRCRIRSGGDLRRSSTYLPQNPRLDPRARVTDILNYLGKLRGVSVDRVEAFGERLGLSALGDALVGTLSGGTRQRVVLAFALASETPLLLLDEPATGLDPWERIRFNEEIAGTAQDRLLLYSTHVIAEVELVTDRLMVLDSGGIRFVGDVKRILDLCPVVREAVMSAEALSILRRRGNRVTSVRRVGKDQHVVRWLACMPTSGDVGVEVAPTLTDAYLALTVRSE